MATDCRTPRIFFPMADMAMQSQRADDRRDQSAADVVRSSEVRTGQQHFLVLETGPCTSAGVKPPHTVRTLGVVEGADDEDEQRGVQ